MTQVHHYSGKSIMPRSGQRKYEPGDTVGQWTVLGFSDHGKYKYFWQCKCSCGLVKDVQQTHLASGKSTKCSKCSNGGVKNGRYSHGMASARVYKIWSDMKSRCLNPGNKHHADYGGRGISICDRWANSFEAFLTDMGEPPTPRHSIDRIDVNGHYTPGNCRWATMTEQARNRRNNRLIEFGGETMCLSEWAEKTGLGVSVIKKRLSRGWPTSKALVQPSMSQHRKSD